MDRILVCAPAERVDSLTARAKAELEAATVETVANPIDAVGLFLSKQPTHVVIDGELDARGGVRIATAMSGTRTVPTVLVVEPGLKAEVQAAVRRRGLPHVQVRTWVGGAAPPLFVTTVSIEPFRRTSPILEDSYDAIVLLGSAGTPHMLPTLVPRLRRGGVPLVVAVHHNPRLSESFAEWIGGLAGVPAHPLRTGARGLPSLTVARASGEVEDLQPNLDEVLIEVLDRCPKLLVVVASGMEFDGLHSVRVALAKDATLVALRPELCPQPAMVQRLIDGELEPALCTQEEIARIISLSTRAGAMQRAS